MQPKFKQNQQIEFRLCQNQEKYSFHKGKIVGIASFDVISTYVIEPEQPISDWRYSHIVLPETEFKPC